MILPVLTKMISGRCCRKRAEPVLLLKHSTACPIPRRRGGRGCSLRKGAEAKCREVLVIEQRPLSRWIAEETACGMRRRRVIFVDGECAGRPPDWDITLPAPRGLCQRLADSIADRLRDIFRVRATTSSGSVGAGGFVPLEGFQVIAHELLVEAVLRAARL